MYLEKTGHIILQEEKLTAQQKAHPQFVSFDIYIYIDLDIYFVESPSSLAWIRDGN